VLFSLKQDKNSKHNEDYAGKFDNLMNQASSSNLSEKEKDFIKRQIEAKKIADEKASLDHDIKKAENERKKKQDFEDLL
jgi:hypothetical protein